MTTYFVEYMLTTDYKTRAFFAESNKPEDEVREIITTRLKVEYGKSVTDIEITKQNENKRNRK